jgi:IclR family pca regulon transcriptional regulator
MRKLGIEKPRYFINSLSKGLSVLEIFSERGGPLTLSEISNAMGTNNATATRFLYTLTQLGFIQRDEQRRYYPTPKVLSLGYAFISGSDWREVASYYLERLSNETQATTNLSILEGKEILYVIRIRKRKYLPFDIRIGSKLPVYCTAMGKVLMALGPSEKVNPILKTLEFKPLTHHTITSLNKFMEELEKVRKKGYALNDEELTIGNRAIGAPVLDKNGDAIAAINIAVPTSQYNRRELEKNIAPILIQTGRQISDALLKMESPFIIGGSS